MRIGRAPYIGIIDHTADSGDHIHAIIDAFGDQPTCCPLTRWNTRFGPFRRKHGS
jgi:hypothetical protein